MASSEDTEITLGTGKLLFLFFGLVGICALFFGFGYSLGRKSEPASTTGASVAPAPQAASSAAKPGTAAQPMTFYKAVQQTDANADLTPAKTDSASTGDAPIPNAAQNPAQPAPSAPTSPDPTTTLPAAGYFVQVAAVSKPDDAQALVEALKKKQYPAFVAASSTTDKLFHVQVGPFSDIKDAEAMRARLVSDGYTPILKK
jgi:cell division septation protein DedD